MILSISEVNLPDLRTLYCLSEQVRHMFDEIDYILEAKNAERFASLYASHPRKFSSTCNKHNLFSRCTSLYIMLVCLLLPPRL